MGLVVDQFHYLTVPSDPAYSDIEFRSDKTVVFSEVSSSSAEKHQWCQITRNSHPFSATLQNKRYQANPE